MSRSKGQVICRESDFVRKQSVIQSFLVQFFILDLWIFLRARQILKIFLALLRPTLEILGLITLGIGLLSLYAFHNVKSVTQNFGENIRSNQLSFLRLPDNSATRVSIEKELFNLKRRIINLDFTLRKMDSQLKSLHPYKKEKDEELADFAAESVGGHVIETPDTESFYEPDDYQVSLFGIPVWKPNYFTPRKVIQPWAEAGECWAFRGFHGKIKIELPYIVTISHVTLEHIPVSLSITSTIDSAPKEFVVIGEYRNKYVTIDKFVYDIHGLPSQTFLITNENARKIPFKVIMLEVLSNWGNPRYTCIYRFKVHGKISELFDELFFETSKN